MILNEVAVEGHIRGSQMLIGGLQAYLFTLYHCPSQHHLLSLYFIRVLLVIAFRF